MLIGYARVSKGDGSQALDLQLDALREAGVADAQIYSDMASGARSDRPGLDNALRALREGDTLVVWKLDRLGRSVRHLVETVNALRDRGVQVRILTGELAGIDTSTTMGNFFFVVFAGLAEVERSLISERTKAGLKAARKRGRKGGRPPALSGEKRRMAVRAMKDPDTNVSALARELGVSPNTLYRLQQRPEA